MSKDYEKIKQIIEQSSNNDIFIMKPVASGLN